MKCLGLRAGKSLSFLGGGGGGGGALYSRSACFHPGVQVGSVEPSGQ